MTCRLIHFVWFGPRPLGYTEFLAVKTARKIYGVEPYLWTDNSVPENEWLLRIKEIAVQKQIKSEWQQIANLASKYNYKSDYLRYQLLHDYGGLYLDIDTLCVKPIFGLVLQGLVAAQQQSSKEPINGAVMYVAEPQHPVVAALLNESIRILREVKSMTWSEIGPKLLSKTLKPNIDCTILPHEHFYFYKSSHWRQIFEDNPIDDQMCVIHWWNKHAGAFARKTVNPEYIRTSNSLYAKVVKRVLGSDYGLSQKTPALSAIVSIMGDHPQRARNFEATLRCIQQQDFQDYELVIVEQYIEKPLWESRAKSLNATYMAITESTLPDWARFCLSWCKNVGARVSKHDTLLMLDGDVAFGNDYFSRVVSTFRTDWGYLMGFSLLIRLNTKGTGIYLRDGTYHAEWPREHVEKTNNPGFSGSGGGGGSVVFDKRFFFDVIGGYSENYFGWGKEDKDCLLRAYRFAGGNEEGRLRRMDYTLLHLFHRHIGLAHRPKEATTHYFKYTRPYPRRVTHLLVEAQVGRPEHRTLIDLSRLDSPSAGCVELQRSPLSQEERVSMLGNHHPEYSFEDFTNQKLFDATDLDGSVIVGSCFYQDPDSQDADPRVKVFPDDMQGVTFIECNLDNVYVPPGNTVDLLCSCRRIKRQNDGESWILNEDLVPIEPLSKERLAAVGGNIVPRKIPRRAIRKEELRRLRSERMKKFQEFYASRERQDEE